MKHFSTEEVKGINPMIIDAGNRKVQYTPGVITGELQL